MTREQTLKQLHDSFISCANAFCGKSGGLFAEILPEYKGEETAENLKFLSAQISYNSFIIEFKYNAKSFMNVAQSILECYVYLEKDEYAIAIPLPLLLDYCNVDEPTPLCIPMIASTDGMCQAFDHIGNTILNFLPTLTAICTDEERKYNVIQAFCEEANIILDLKLPSPIICDGENRIIPYIDDYLYSFFTLRFCAAPFINAIKGDLTTAVKQLKKQKKRMGYEDRMLHLWESDQISVKELTHVQKYVKTLNKSGIPNQSAREFFAFFLSWIVLTIPYSAVYVGFYMLLVTLESQNSILVLGSLSNIPYCILFAFLSAIATSYYLRFFFYKLLFPKQYDTYRETDRIQNGKSDDKLIKGLLTIIVIAAIAGSVLLAKWNLNFKENGFIDNSKFLSVKGITHSYSEIEKVYYLPNRVNGFGETIEYPSYVIRLKDGREIDLYELEEIEYYEDKLIPYLKEKGVFIDDSERK